MSSEHRYLRFNEKLSLSSAKNHQKTAKTSAWALLGLTLFVYGALVNYLMPIWLPSIITWIELFKGQPAVWLEPTAELRANPLGPELGSDGVVLIILGGLYLTLGWLSDARTLYLGGRRPTQSLFDLRMRPDHFMISVLIYRPGLIASVALAIWCAKTVAPMLYRDQPLWHQAGFGWVVAVVTGAILLTLAVLSLRGVAKVYFNWTRGPVIGASAVVVSRMH